MKCGCELLPGSIPYLEVGQAGSPLFVLSGGQAFMRRSSPDRIRREATRISRLLPKGHGFTLFGYGPRRYAEAGLDGLADGFARILECRPGPVKLVGISYGGVVAARLAARHAGLVSDLVLVSSAAEFSDEGRRRLRRQIDLASQRRYAELLTEFGGVFRRPWYNLLLQARLAIGGAGLAGEMNPPDTIMTYLRAALTTDGPDSLSWLSRITARTLVIGGEHDQFFGDRMAMTAEAIGNARLHLFPNETHMAPVERASAFRRKITAFLGGPRTASRPDASGQYGPTAAVRQKGIADV